MRTASSRTRRRRRGARLRHRLHGRGRGRAPARARTRRGELWDALLDAGATPGRARRPRHAAARGLLPPLRQRPGRATATRSRPGLGWCCKEETGFIGSEAVAAARASGTAERLAPFVLTEPRHPAPGQRRARATAAEAGEVTSGTLSPCSSAGSGWPTCARDLAEPGPRSRSTSAGGGARRGSRSARCWRSPAGLAPALAELDSQYRSERVVRRLISEAAGLQREATELATGGFDAFEALSSVARNDRRGLGSRPRTRGHRDRGTRLRGEAGQQERRPRTSRTSRSRKRHPVLSVNHANTADTAKPSGPAGGDLAGDYPDPVIGPQKVDHRQDRRRRGDGTEDRRRRGRSERARRHDADGERERQYSGQQRRRRGRPMPRRLAGGSAAAAERTASSSSGSSRSSPKRVALGRAQHRRRPSRHLRDRGLPAPGPVIAY